MVFRTEVIRSMYYKKGSCTTKIRILPASLPPISTFSDFCHITRVVNPQRPSQVVDNTEHLTSFRAIDRHCCMQTETTISQMWQTATNSYSELTQYQKTYSPAAQGVNNDAIARSPNLTPAWCDLDLWPPTPKVELFIYLHRGPLVPICSKIGTFVFNIQHAQGR